MRQYASTEVLVGSPNSASNPLPHPGSGGAPSDYFCNFPKPTLKQATSTGCRLILHADICSQTANRGKSSVN